MVVCSGGELFVDGEGCLWMGSGHLWWGVVIDGWGVVIHRGCHHLCVGHGHRQLSIGGCCHLCVGCCHPWGGLSSSVDGAWLSIDG